MTSDNNTTTYVLTGGSGFLGWHVKLALHAQGHQIVDLPLGDRFRIDQATSAIGKADHLIHLAGVNRAADDDIARQNRQFAEQLAEAILYAERVPASITYANSIQRYSDSIYGSAKQAAGELLARTADRIDSAFRNIDLPNLFGEHGRPFYNSVVATFSYLLATGEGEPRVQEDRELTLLHAQDAADWLISPAEDAQMTNRFRRATVTDVLEKLRTISETYRDAEFPDISDPFSRDLFNTYRSYVPVAAIPLKQHTDNRGSFVEMARSHGGTGQSSFSTTHPGISRGNHYHRRKIERFVVLGGKAQLGLRRVFTDRVITIMAEGQPIALDQPIGWTHNLTNTGDETLIMYFWTNDIFDPDNPDTYAETV